MQDQHGGRCQHRRSGWTATIGDAMFRIRYVRPAYATSLGIANASQLDCSLHVHAVTTPHNYGRVFSSTAPGFVMAVGSVGDYLLDYGQWSLSDLRSTDYN